VFSYPQTAQEHYLVVYHTAFYIDRSDYLRVASWQEYELIDVSRGEKLERFGDFILIRPDPQAIWQFQNVPHVWAKAMAHYHRSNTGGGYWTKIDEFPDLWTINYGNLKFNIKLMGFKHIGIFPEQAVNWDYIMQRITNASRPIKILNLFAYTGGATLAAAHAGASVCHVDASKGMVAWAKENACISNLKNASIRWIVDDCIKFVQRENRRNNRYDAIILDPPSYGRGPSGEFWKIEDNLASFLEMCEQLLAKEAEFLILNSYTTGLSPSVMKYLLNTVVAKKRGGEVKASEIGIKVSTSGLIFPCGSTAIWSRD
jgi:23S rRNA (cytosine1962-C5)-methyltransferase